MKAFLVVDMSNDFVDDNGGLTAGKPAQDIVNNIIDTADLFLGNGELVIFAMDAHEKDDEHFKLWPAHNVKDTWGAELYGDIGKWYEKNKDNENVIFLEKPEYDAFYNTQLYSILEAAGVDTVLVGGVCTDICVMQTVYGAYKEGLNTEVDPDLTATFTENKETFLAHMESTYKTKITNKG